MFLVVAEMLKIDITWLRNLFVVLNWVLTCSGYNTTDQIKVVKMSWNIHNTLTKTVFRPIGYQTFTSIALNICALINNYFFIDKLWQARVEYSSR